MGDTLQPIVSEDGKFQTGNCQTLDRDTKDAMEEKKQKKTAAKKRSAAAAAAVAVAVDEEVAQSSNAAAASPPPRKRSKKEASAATAQIAASTVAPSDTPASAPPTPPPMPVAAVATPKVRKISLDKVSAASDAIAEVHLIDPNRDAKQKSKAAAVLELEVHSDVAEFIKKGIRGLSFNGKFVTSPKSNAPLMVEFYDHPNAAEKSLHVAAFSPSQVFQDAKLYLDNRSGKPQQITRDEPLAVVRVWSLDGAKVALK
nr:MAG: hypothetical protein [Apis mellifra filamentous-like virus]